MPSPFPGMDPFLEHPAFFPDLHDSLITYVREWLQSQLPAPYFCMIGSRVWVEQSQRPIGPDVNVLRTNGNLAEEKTSSSEGGIAVATKAKPILITVPNEEVRETSVDIFAQHNNEERLVTSLEVLSPTNKTKGEPGRESYLRKQREILASQVNLVEIDLLRGGEPTTTVPNKVAQERAGPFDYQVCINRFPRRDNYLIYPILVTSQLPEIAIPLLPDDADVPLDLQAVFNRAYDTGPYSRRVRYQEELLNPPLRPNLMEWLHQVLAAKKA